MHGVENPIRIDLKVAAFCVCVLYKQEHIKGKATHFAPESRFTLDSIAW